MKQTVEKKRWAGRPEGMPTVQLKKKVQNHLDNKISKRKNEEQKTNTGI